MAVITTVNTVIDTTATATTATATTATATTATATTATATTATATTATAFDTLASITNRTVDEIKDLVSKHMAIYPKLDNKKISIKNTFEPATIDDFKSANVTDDRIEKFNISKCIDVYNTYDFSDYVLLGFTVELKRNTEKSGLYMLVCESESFNTCITLDRYSSADENKDFSYNHILRFRPLTKQKNALIENGIALKICDIDVWNNFKNKCYYHTSKGYIKASAGESFEMFCTEYFRTNDKHWTKDNNDFTNSHDIISDNIGYNIKFEKGQLAQILKLESVSGLDLASEINK